MFTYFVFLHLGASRGVKTVVEVGFYKYQDEVGYRGWVTFEREIAFERLDGKVILVKKPN
jgi:hypothetical protein